MRISILGTRGIPARHGGFESFAEALSLYLVERGWAVTVYCQGQGRGPIQRDRWHGVQRVTIPVRMAGALSTVVFDWVSSREAAQCGELVLTLGYNTALFGLRYRLRGVPQIINMDGIEWRRSKYGGLERAWLYLNEWAGALLADHLVADHPGIARHLKRRAPARKISMIPYGTVAIEDADPGHLETWSLEPGGYALVVARPEPENGLVDIVTAFSARTRPCLLAVVSPLDARRKRYHRRVLAAAGDQVRFLGGVYAPGALPALRRFARLHIHGHTVGGTNPSLLEALAAGTPVLAHDNPFNRWVVGNAGAYYQGQSGCAHRLDALLEDADELRRMSEHARARFDERFRWEQIRAEYEKLLLEWRARAGPDHSGLDEKRE